MQQDVGIAERQKVQKQGRDGHLKQVYNPPTGIFFHNRHISKRYVGGLYT